MVNRPRHALTRQMHFFAELKAVADELRGSDPGSTGHKGEPFEDLAWREALRRRRARLLATARSATAPA